MVYLRYTHWVSSSRDTGFGKTGWYRLQGEGHVGSGCGLRGNGLLAPEVVDVFVKRCIDFSGRASIVVT